ncbi:MAG: hypothetical protein R3F53_14855 [Gammaproteobacteria bacterium]
MPPSASNLNFRSQPDSAGKRPAAQVADGIETDLDSPEPGDQCDQQTAQQPARDCWRNIVPVHADLLGNTGAQIKQLYADDQVLLPLQHNLGGYFLSAVYFGPARAVPEAFARNT